MTEQRSLGSMIEVMQAAEGGAKIDDRLLNGGKWSFCPKPSWNWEVMDYRVHVPALLPCPWCGGEPKQLWCYIGCEKCQAFGPNDDKDGKKWNRVAEIAMDSKEKNDV